MVLIKVDKRLEVGRRRRVFEECCAQNALHLATATGEGNKKEQNHDDLASLHLVRFHFQRVHTIYK